MCNGGRDSTATTDRVCDDATAVPGAATTSTCRHAAPVTPLAGQVGEDVVTVGDATSKRRATAATTARCRVAAVVTALAPEGVDE